MNARNDGIVNIHGKEYQTVALRVATFRHDHPDYSLSTEIVYRDENCVVMKAVISNGDTVLATGHSEEYRTSSSINKTSALENSETSAIGRALAALGYGGTEFATADEVANAINNKQPASKRLPALDEKKGKEEARKWLQIKSLLLDEDGDPDEERITKEWFELPSNVRSAIKKYGPEIEAEEIDRQAEAFAHELINTP